MQILQGIASFAQRQWNVLVSLVVLYLAGPSARYSCASPAIAVGREVFRADAGTIVEILIRIQSMCSTFSRITRVSVCRHQMVACKQSSQSERYDALTLPDRNMGEV